MKSTEAVQGAITMCATVGAVQIDGNAGVNIGTNFGGTCSTDSVTIGAAGVITTFAGDISANGDINATGPNGNIWYSCNKSH